MRGKNTKNPYYLFTFVVICDYLNLMTKSC